MKNFPKKLLRYPTSTAIHNLASRLGLPRTLEMQDWEHEVADPKRINEFLNVYLNEKLTDDEKFVLMEIILQSSEESDRALFKQETWAKILTLLEKNINIHIYSVWYWSDVEQENDNESWEITPFLRKILEKHKNILNDD